MATTSTPRDAAEVTRAIAAGPTRTIETEAAALATWTFGQGPDLVLIHGWPLHAATFRHLVPALARAFTCHLIDLPGAGQSGRLRGGGPNKLRRAAAAVGEVVDALGLTRFGVYAHDSGAVVARLAAAAAGDRVDALVLGNTEIPGHRPWQVRAMCALAALPGGGRLLIESLRLTLVRHSPITFGACFRDPAYGDGEFYELFIAPLLRSRALAAGQLDLLHDFDWALIDALEDVHRQLRAPVRMIWGDGDPYFPLAKARAMVEQFAGEASLSIIPGARLFAHEDAADEVLAVAIPFLEENMSRETAA